jgi:hypothetical protein
MPKQRQQDEPRIPDQDPRPDVATDDDDVAGHVFLRAVEPAGSPDGDDDVEGHAFYRSGSSRGE